MAKVMSLSTKPVTRGQAGTLCDKLSHRLQNSKTMQSERFEKVNKDKVRNKALLDDLVAAVQKHVDALGDIIRVDRKIRPAYPDWMDKPMHPELEAKGPREFDAGKLEQWLYDGQKNGGVCKGKLIYEHLISNNMLESCAGLRDLEEIQKRGIDFFRKHFAGKAVFGWKSVVLNRDGRQGVPYLVGRDGQVVLRWRWLGFDWLGANPALRFAR